MPLPVPEDAPFFVKDYSEYYMGRCYHKRSLNSNDGWNSIGCMSFMNQPILQYSNEIRSAVLIMHGDKAHSYYFGKDAYEAMIKDSKYTDNKEILTKECERGANDAGHDVELISLKGKEIKFCIGCLACQSKSSCVLKDDVPEIMEKVKNAEVIVYATPIYYYEMSVQMKVLLDRLNPLYPTDYAFRDIYMIATAAEDEESAFEKAYNGLQGWVNCFEKTVKELKASAQGAEIVEGKLLNRASDKQIVAWVKTL